MNIQTSAIGTFRPGLELFGIIPMRLRPVQRTWAARLAAVNSACLLFIQHIEAQVALGAAGTAVPMQAAIYRRQGFIRLLGLAHALWVPMLAWIALRLDALPRQETAFRAWLITPAATNAASLVTDARNATRFILGERRPACVWR
jgi:hypothetical protein